MHTETANPSQQQSAQAVDGIKDALPIMMAVIPFAAVFGAVAMEKGLSFAEMLLASATIFAGASQYVMVELLSKEAPAWSIVLSVFAINFRHLLYSASLGRYMKAFSSPQKAGAFFLLTDPQFAASETRAAQQNLRPSYYFGYAATTYIVWITANVAGAMFGSLISEPEAFGMDLILPLYFTGLLISSHKRPSFFSVLAVSCCTSWLVYYSLGSPWHITLGGLAGLVVAAIQSNPQSLESSHE